MIINNPNGTPLETKFKVNLKLLNKKQKSCVIIQPRSRKCIKRYGFL